MKDSIKEGALISTLSLIGVVALISLLFGSCAAEKKYSVWAAGQTGMADMARAEQNRQIRVREAEAKYDAAEFDAKTEVRRAAGLADAIRIVKDELGGSEAYLRHMWIEAMAEGGDDVIYIPTEAGLPILEAGARWAK